MSPDPIGITAAAAVTSLDDDLASTVDRMLCGESGVTGSHRFNVLGARFGAAPIGAVRPKTVEHVLSRTDQPHHLLSLALARYVTGEVLKSLLCACVPDRTGLILATTKGDIDVFTSHVLGDQGVDAEAVSPLFVLDHLADASSIAGPRVVISNACASGLVAMIQGAKWLNRGWCDRVIVVGVDVCSRFTVEGFGCLGALSQSRCRPFDRHRDGLNLGEAAAALVMERGGDANVLGWMRGWTVTNDASHLTAPRRDAKELTHAIQKSLTMANRSATQIDYINAHGTGTSYNDEVESVAYDRVFGARTPVTSMKGYFGHTLGAAGVLEAAVCLNLMQRSKIPASIGFEESGITGNINIPIAPVDAVLQNVLTVKTGFGGINAAVVLGGRVDD